MDAISRSGGRVKRHEEMRNEIAAMSARYEHQN